MRLLIRSLIALALAAPSCAAQGQPPPKQPAMEPPSSATRPGSLLPLSVTAPEGSPIGRMGRVREATYRMGSNVGEPDERPAHEVRVSAFDMDMTEVTVSEYAKCVRAGGCVPAPTVVQFPGVTPADEDLYDSECNDDRPERQDHAENCVDWSMAAAYCRWAGKRLPTEEEWEYAACGGNCDQALGGRGGPVAILGAERWPFTTRVGKTSPGAFGLYDMAGNVWEWTSSTYCPYDHPGCADRRRVIRGGSWSMVDYLFVRLTDRSPSEPSTRNTNVGFRCARSG